MDSIYLRFIFIFSTVAVIYGRPDHSNEDQCPLVMTADDNNLKLCPMMLNGVERLCCACNRGEKLTELCKKDDYQSTVCTPCESGTYIDEDAHNLTECHKDNLVCPPGRIHVSSTRSERPRCDCPDGKHVTKDDQCETHTPCGVGYGVRIKGTYNSDIQCQKCPHGFTSLSISTTEECTRIGNGIAPGADMVNPTTNPTTTTNSSNSKCESSDRLGVIILLSVIVGVESLLIILFIILLCRFCKKKMKATNGAIVRYSSRNNGDGTDGERRHLTNDTGDNSRQDGDVESASRSRSSTESRGDHNSGASGHQSTGSVGSAPPTGSNDEEDQSLRFIDEDGVCRPEDEDADDERCHARTNGVDANGAESIHENTAAPDVSAQPEPQVNNSMPMRSNSGLQNGIDHISAHGSSSSLTNHASPPTSSAPINPAPKVTNHNEPSPASGISRKVDETESKMKRIAFKLSKQMRRHQTIDMYRLRSPAEPNTVEQFIDDLPPNNSSDVFYKVFTKLRNELSSEFNPEAIEEFLREHGMSNYADDVADIMNDVA